MQMISVKVHNFRSFKDVTFKMDGYSLLIGENNAGKSNLMNAIRVFYEDGIKFNYETDFPKFETDEESWIEIEYVLKDDEQECLKESYQSSDNLLRVRKILFSRNKEICKTSQSNIYCYENGVLSDKLFYGAKNISQAKLGKVIYIPEVSKMNDAMKLTGPSPFRDLLNLAFKKVISNSNAYQTLQDSFLEFNLSFSDECNTSDFSIQNVINDINKSIESWGVLFGVNINPVDIDTIVKSLVSHYIEDVSLGNAKVRLDSYGQGMQRHIIFTLIRLASKYNDLNSSSKDGVFDPDYVLILFEEPEAFLHPCQQELLNRNLKKMGRGNQQVLITSHSPAFVCRNIVFLHSLIKINKSNAISNAYQIKGNELEDLFAENGGLFYHCCNLMADKATDDDLRRCLKNKGLGADSFDINAKLEEESLKYLLWIDTERSSMFFAKTVLICEGATEKALFDYLLSTDWGDLKEKNVYVLDAMGKFNIHRYMNLFSKIGIDHAVLFDLDGGNSYHRVVNDFIKENRNIFTKNILTFPQDLETFLEIDLPARKDLKPLNLMQALFEGTVKKARLEELRELVASSFVDSSSAIPSLKP
ncbi:hypothetical protein SYK_18620 [Pseudodesulfovibrio nedwellii]|uniref:ATP-dependent endonuclease n=1 Tax=Pseudodesulfovibrio nedwellii TaxID=2973072 RepID=A0ABN6S5Z5_9BACT|nr:AAA family ATPase [Pseudodesulfovibrio nedwellii]BDQ37502.1 hypothetical protein SYK_18620 [Pseudodesulfovibrio nedwellii]